MGGGLICAAVSEDEALGLTLAGVREILIWRPDEPISRLQGWYKDMLDRGSGVMILSIECTEGLHEELFRKRSDGRFLPITVTLPGEGEDKRASDLIKRAIGMVSRDEGGV